MSARLLSALLVVIGLIHVLPVAGVLGAARLNELYGVEIAANELELLLRHRAVLFGLLGGFITWAAFMPALQPAAIAMAGLSILSFLILAAVVEDTNASIRRVVLVDWIALSCWLVAAGLWYHGR